MKRIAPLVLLAAVVALAGCNNNGASKTTPMTFEEKAPENAYPGLFEAVQLSAVFPDSKTFVDAVPKADPQAIMKAYHQQKDQPDFALNTFVEEWFAPPPAFASGFEADTARSVTEHIQALWPVLTREADQQALGSLIPLPYPYIVPGGRFGEIYYWDSYFTMLGLKASGNHQYMIHNMVNNFAYLMDTVGFIPNGNRTYFLGRSQPPFFSMMVKLLADMDPKVSVADYLPQLEREYMFWMDGDTALSPSRPAYRRVIMLPNGTYLNRYWDDQPEPRPESYKEDMELAFENPERDRVQLFRDLRAACESGWDFSSRWLTDPDDLGTIRTTEIIPVDLNVLLWHSEMMLSTAYEQSGNTEKSTQYRLWAEERADAINEYLWDPRNQMYSDYVWTEGTPTGIPTLAMSFPLLHELASDEQASQTARWLEEEFLEAGGLSTTLSNSGQQWDAPNGWAPLHYVSIAGLRKYGYNELAREIGQRWIAINTAVYSESGKMTEKYNVMETNLKAGGGEYPVQDGFGWTNGVLLNLIADE